MCHDRDGGVRAVLAEVHNTFGERHDYLRRASRTAARSASGETLEARKVFHVSPFCEVKGRYAFRFHFGPTRWLARIDYFDDDARRAAARDVDLGRRAAADRARRRARCSWRYRWFTLGVVARIHWQALRSCGRSACPFFSKPSPPARR